ncbi:MAG: alpha-L-fucosidase [Armatimonadetes bacterium]|nr:alpha-L-fucosidase [Armatimonadota bacterium]
MPTRREVCQSIAGLAASAALPTHLFAPKEVVSMMTPYHEDTPLHQLQQRFVDLRFGMFLHFNMATFQDREWGDPTGPVEAFDPTDLDTDQWAAAAKSAGMTYACLTTKHHDGFCIWPTKTKVASILQTPKKIDVVKAYTDSFRRAGLTVGLYFSILDLRNDIRHFNVNPAKIKLIKDQLTELLTNYGEIDVLIFDGWDAPWSRIPYSEVPFHEIYALVKRLQPNCLISELNASQYPDSALYYSDIKAFEQNAGQALPGDSSIPAQSCVTLTDGWFWKQGDENAELKPTHRIVEEWLKPQNERHCNLILNAPPNREGRLAPNVVARLREIGEAWHHPGPAPKVDSALVITTPNLATGQIIHANVSPDTYGPDFANDGKFSTTWYLESGYTEGWLEVTFKRPTDLNTLVLVEPVGKFDDYKKSRIKSYKFERWDGRQWVELVSGATPSRVQMHAIPPTRTMKIRLSIEAAQDTPHIADIGIYFEPRG